MRSKRPTHAEERIFNSTSLLTSKAQLFLLHLSWRVIAPLITIAWSMFEFFFVCVYAIPCCLVVVLVVVVADLLGVLLGAVQLPVAPQSPLPLLVLLDAARDGRDQRLPRSRAAGQRTTGTARGHSACHTLLDTHHPPSGFSRAHTRIFNPPNYII
jgi:hypothetical protein